jgi:hypothetical protein
VHHLLRAIHNHTLDFWMAQSGVSLLTIALVAARAVNILA